MCRGLGYNEILTYSFIAPAYYNKIRMPEKDPRRNSIAILNPLGEETSIMRTTALPSLLETLARNNSHRNPSASCMKWQRYTYLWKARICATKSSSSLWAATAAAWTSSNSRVR